MGVSFASSQTVFDFLSQRHNRLCHFNSDLMDYFLAGEDQQQPKLSLTTWLAVDPNLVIFASFQGLGMVAFAMSSLKRAAMLGTSALTFSQLSAKLPSFGRAMYPNPT